MFPELESYHQFLLGNQSGGVPEQHALTQDLFWDAICVDSSNLQAFPSVCEVDTEEVLRRQFDTCPKEPTFIGLNEDIQTEDKGFVFKPYDDAEATVVVSSTEESRPQLRDDISAQMKPDTPSEHVNEDIII